MVYVAFFLYRKQYLVLNININQNTLLHIMVTNRSCEQFIALKIAFFISAVLILDKTVVTYRCRKIVDIDAWDQKPVYDTRFMTGRSMFMIVHGTQMLPFSFKCC